MDQNAVYIAIIAAIVLVAIIALALLARRNRSNQLRSRFGPEYTRAVEVSGDRRQAEAALAARADRVRKYHLRPLKLADQQRFAAAWRHVQAQFVDDPRGAAQAADDLLGEVMTARGYPEGDFGQRLEDLSVDHGEKVQNYRLAHEITLRHVRGDASTEDMRQAMIHYRALFAELVGEPLPLRAAS